MSNLKIETKQQTPEEFIEIVLDEIIRTVKKMKRKPDHELREELIKLDTLIERAIGVLQIYRTLTK